MDINNVIIKGRLTRDPELTALPSGVMVCNFTVATNRSWVDNKTGEQRERVDYHNIVAGGKKANECDTNLEKGSTVMVTGFQQTRKWESKSKEVRYKTEVIVEKVSFGQKPWR